MKPPLSEASTVLAYGFLLHWCKQISGVLVPHRFQGSTLWQGLVPKEQLMERNFWDRKMRKDNKVLGDRNFASGWPQTSCMTLASDWDVANHGRFTNDFNERRIWFSYSRLLIFSSVKQNNYPYLILWCATKSSMNFSNRSCSEAQHLAEIPELALGKAAPEMAAWQPRQLRHKGH